MWSLKEIAVIKGIDKYPNTLPQSPILGRNPEICKILELETVREDL